MRVSQSVNNVFEILSNLGHIFRAGSEQVQSKDIHDAFFGNVVRGKNAFFRLVVRNGFAHFVRKVFARRKLLPGNFGVFAPLLSFCKRTFKIDIAMLLNDTLS